MLVVLLAGTALACWVLVRGSSVWRIPLGVGYMVLGFMLPWIVPAYAGSAIVRERESSTFDLLRVTLLTERSIVLGKLGGCLARLWPAVLTLLFMLPHQVLQGVTGRGLDLSLFSWSMMYPWLGSWWSASRLWLAAAALIEPWARMLLYASMGLFLSAFFRSTRVAVVLSYAAALTAQATLWIVTAPAVRSLAGAGSYNISSARFAPWVPLAIVFVEIVGAMALLWGAVWRLKRI